LGDIIIKYKNTLLYTALIYKNIYLNNNIDTKKIPIYRGSMLEWDNCPRTTNCAIFDYYSPEQFYILNKIIIEWTKRNYNKENRIIFINAWNEWGEGSYLEPDDKYGYASINSLSKALFNLSYIKTNNLSNFNVNDKILVQAHLNYDYLIEEIINFTNNIPVKFDLFISLSSKIVNKDIQKYIKNNSKAYNYEIKTFPNEKDDILPFLEQVMDNIKKYKYCCHIYSKKSIHIDFEDEWRNYLLNNLLGDRNIISEILTEFKINESLGFIYPETFYKVLKIFGKKRNDFYSKRTNLLLNEIFPNVKIVKTYFEFPEGNMFWAKTNAIYQIFDKYFVLKIKKENQGLDNTIQNSLERIWIYLVKLNGYYYKKIFKHT